MSQRKAVKATDGSPVTKNITGTLTWPGYVGEQVRNVSVDDKGFVVAARPPLVQSRQPPAHPSPKLLALLRGVCERLAD